MLNKQFDTLSSWTGKGDILRKVSTNMPWTQETQ